MFLRTWRALRLCGTHSVIVNSWKNLKNIWLALRQHLAAGLSRSQAFVVTIFLRNIASLVEVTASLAANNHGNGAFANGELGVNLIGFDEIDLPRADEQVARLANLGVIGLRAIVQPVVTNHFLMT